jgi:hypothetical protein
MDDLTRFETSLTRISARFAVQALDSVDFHHLDEDLSEGKLDPRFVPVIRKSVEMADPVLFPTALKELAGSLRASLLKLEAALVCKGPGVQQFGEPPSPRIVPPTRT